jgi:hypothetical protein
MLSVIKRRAHDPRASCVGVLFILVIVVSTGCDSVGRTEIRRIPSPDSRVDAVLLEGSGGATTGFFYEIHLVLKGGAAPASKEDPVIRIAFAGADDLTIEWSRPKLLAIKYKQGWIQRFTNRWSWNDGKGASYVVELQLVPPAGKEFALPETLRF